MELYIFWSIQKKKFFFCCLCSVFLGQRGKDAASQRVDLLSVCLVRHLNVFPNMNIQSTRVSNCVGVSEECVWWWPVEGSHPANVTDDGWMNERMFSVHPKDFIQDSRPLMSQQKWQLQTRGECLRVEFWGHHLASGSPNSHVTQR